MQLGSMKIELELGFDHAHIFAKKLEKQRAFRGDFNIPRMKKAIFENQNISPKSILTIQKSQYIFGHESSLHTFQVFNSQTTLSFTSSNFVPSDKLNATTIAIFRPKKIYGWLVNGVNHYKS